MHQGKSFTREAAEAAARLGLSLVALSSRPERPEVLEQTREHLADCVVTDADELTPYDIKNIASVFAGRGYALEAAIATFEGYRVLMAALNQELGARDSSVRSLELCLNKFDLRRFLFERGLSEVRGYKLAGDARPDLDPGARWFVKPVRGASSFAAFVLDDAKALAELPEIQEQMRRDHRMRAIFMDQYDFLVEEYVEGPEFSFETILLDEPRHLCVHEKARVERLERTTLEGMSISPPCAVGRDEVLRGADYVSEVFAALRGLGLTDGAFHVEAKYWAERDRWEIIEINPRMGGSLIQDSVAAVTGESILELWIASLTAAGAPRERLRERLDRCSQLTQLRRGTARRATLFLSKYGEKGRTVEYIEFAPVTRRPSVLKLLVKPGTTLDDSDRAIALMDALWEVDIDDLPAEVEFLDRHAAEYFHVEYS
jgi:biotin carboxylase